MEDFIVKSEGYCFLCSDKISNQRCSTKNLASEGEVAPVQTHSLQYLSRYLKICMRKVFHQEGPISSDLLEKVERAKLKVELCQECSALNDTFSKLYKKLEKAEMEVISCVSLFHRKFLKAKGDFSSSKSRKDLNGRAEIVQILRAEGLEKCAVKLRDITPRLKIQKLTTKQMNGERQKLNLLARKHAPNKRRSIIPWFPERRYDISEGVNVELIRMEGQTSNLLPCDNIDNDDNDNCEDIDFDYPNDMRNEEMVELKSSTGATHGDAAEGIAHEGHAIVLGMETKAEDNDDDDNGGSGMAQMSTSSGAWSKDKVHHRFNTETGKYECALCSMEFKTVAGAILHYQSVHLKKKLKCNICGKAFTRRSSFKCHYESAHMGVKFKCLGCGKVFNFKTNLNSHQQRTGCGVGLPK